MSKPSQIWINELIEGSFTLPRLKSLIIEFEIPIIYIQTCCVLLIILRLIASDDVIYNNAPWMEFRFSNTSLCIDVNSLFNLIVLLFFTLGLHSCLCGQFVQSWIHFFGPSVLITFHMLRHFKYKFFFVWTYYISLFIFFWN